MAVHGQLGNLDVRGRRARGSEGEPQRPDPQGGAVNGQASRYAVVSSPVIKSFANKATAAVFQGLEVRRLPRELQPATRRKLKLIDAATSLESLRVPPGNRLEALKGNRRGRHSIRVNDQWRICFRWSDGHAWDPEIVDYHH